MRATALRGWRRSGRRRSAVARRHRRVRQPFAACSSWRRVVPPPIGSVASRGELRVMIVRSRVKSRERPPVMVLKSAGRVVPISSIGRGRRGGGGGERGVRG